MPSVSTLPPLTVYSARICPWAQRTTLALRETFAYRDGKVEHVEVDLQNKPADYATRVNKASKVPVLQIGKEGEPGTKFIPESFVLLELVSELFPESGLSPEDPVQRAEARYFAERFNQVLPLNAILYQGEHDKVSAYLSGLDEIQSILERISGPFLLGEKLTFGDLAVAPFVGRAFASAKAGLLPENLAQALLSDPKYATFRAYHDTLVSRPSWKETFDEEYVIGFTKKRIEAARAAK
ncbi:hypothetical protein JCM8547_006897 [Rhodosporidiobolus lusitaniae]